MILVDGNGTRFQLNLPIWWRRYKSRGSFPGDPAMKVQNQSIPPIPGSKLVTKINKSRPMPAYVPGVTPPGMAADKCINTSHHSTTFVMLCIISCKKNLTLYVSLTLTHVSKIDQCSIAFKLEKSLFWRIKRYFDCFIFVSCRHDVVMTTREYARGRRCIPRCIPCAFAL